ncbi:MAG: type II toxin-antitoxin system VapC family toxin [Iamia sp.]
MTETVDTNVLVYASNDQAAEHERARALLDHLAEGPGLVVLLWPTLMGYLRIVTNPSIFASPLRPEVAEASVDALLAQPHIRAAGELDGFWPAYRRVAGPVAPRGNLVPDAHLVALMVQHGITRIWSRDRDLRKFDGITPLDPFSDRSEDGFG